MTRCHSCGAALQPASGADHVVCPYCGSTTPTAALQPARRASERAAARPRRRGWLGVALVLLIAGGGAALFFQAGGTRLLREWYSPPCLVDANGDEVLDAAGWSGTPSAQRTLTVVDGRSGDTLWAGEAAYADGAVVLCAPPDAIAVARPDFTVEIRDARSGTLSGTSTLPDRVLSYGRGERCLRLWTGTGETTGVRTDDAAVTECETDERLNVWSGGVAGPTGHQRPAAQGGFEIEARSSGTPLLTIRARANGALRWELPLNLAADDRSALPLVVTPTAVVTYGVRPGDADAGWLVGLDPTTGRVRYEQRQGSRWSGDLQGFAWNGRYVLAMWGFGLHAYDPATGERRWHIGGR